MKISKIILENFRAYYGINEIILCNFNVFLGRNDQGKSSILEAIDIFFSDGKGIVKLQQDDLNVQAKNEGKDSFRICIVFKDFPDEIIIDETNKTILKDEFLLNNENELEIWKIFKNNKVSSTTIKCLHPANDVFLKNLMTKKIGELQDFAKQNNINVSDNRKLSELRKAIREYYKNKDNGLKFDAIEIPIDAEGLKDIWSKLRNYLPVYGLFHSDRKNIDQDDEIQDPLKLKIEEIFKREDIIEKLGEIASEIEKEIKDIADKTIQKFKELSTEVSEIKPNIPEVSTLKWRDIYKGLGFNTDNDIPLNKRGSGFRRLVLLSSFLADVDRKDTDNSTHIIYAIEEPETSLHPELQLKLINALINLSNKDKYQILLTTHSPALIRLFDTQTIKYVEQEKGHAKVKPFSDTIAEKIIDTMGLLPSIGKVVVCVEGENDRNFLLNINSSIPELKQIIDLDEKEKAGMLCILPIDGSKLKHWIDKYALKNTNALEFHLYDKDADDKYKDYIKKVNNRSDGSSGDLTRFREIENYVSRDIIESEFNIKLNLSDKEKWCEIDLPQKIVSLLGNQLKENAIKSKICGQCSKKMTKEKFEKLGAWDEVEGWFKAIKELVDKCIENAGNKNK